MWYIPIMGHICIFSKILSTRHISHFLKQSPAQNKYLINMKSVSFSRVQFHVHTSTVPILSSLRIYPRSNLVEEKNGHLISSYGKNCASI